MDDTLIKNWNSVVGKEDTVYHLGDFMFKGDRSHYFPVLKGKKILIHGNHDHKHTFDLPWDAQHDYLEFSYGFEGKNTHIVLFHYPIENWHWMGGGALHFYGHIHNAKIPYKKGRFNMSVEEINYTPIELKSIIEKEQNKNVE